MLIDTARIIAVSAVEPPSWFDPIPVSLAIAVAGVIAAIAAAYYGHRALGPPTRRLDLTVQSKQLVTPLSEQSLTIQFNGSSIADPHLVEVYLSAAGKHSVASEHFDQGRPIAIEFTSGTLVADLTSAGSAVHSLSGNRLTIGPDLFARNCTHSFTLLFDGAVSVRDYKYSAHLIDTEVRRRSATPSQESAFRFYLSLMGSCFLVGVVSLFCVLKLVSDSDFFLRVFDLPPYG